MARAALVPAALALPALACGGDASAPASGPTPAAVHAVLDTYASNLFAAYSDSVNDEVAFQAQVEAFLAAPTEATLAQTRAAWLASRAHYMLTEGARFYGGPIVAPPPNHEAAVNSWPLDEAYLDYATGANGAVDETQGLINHPDVLPQISPDAVDALNAQGGDANISDGYHAAEFLLWGQALSPVGPGTRPATDYVVGGPRKNADRRATYLRTVVQGVVTHLTAVRDAWAPGAPYRTQFVGGGMGSVANVIIGVGKMSKGELAGQRMNAAYASKSRRNQHDCFSSLTLVDYVRDAEGLRDIYLGAYGGSVGPSVSSLVRAIRPDVDASLRAQLQASVDAITAIPAPFEASIVGTDDQPGRVAIHAAIESLRAQADLLTQAASALGVQIQVPETNN